MNEDDHLEEAVALLYGLQAGYYRAREGWLDALTARHYEPCGSDAFCGALDRRVEAERCGIQLDGSVLYSGYLAVIDRQPMAKAQADQIEDTLDYMTCKGFFKI